MVEPPLAVVIGRRIFHAFTVMLLSMAMLSGSIYLFFYLFIDVFSIPDAPIPIILKILAGISGLVWLFLAGGLWSACLALLLRQPVGPAARVGAQTWGLTILVGTILIDLTQIPIFLSVRLLQFPHQFHILFTLVFVIGVGIGTWLVVRRVAGVLGLENSKEAAALWSGLAAGGGFLIASLVLLLGFEWEVAGPFAGRRYDMLQIMHVCNLAAAAAAGAVFGWFLGHGGSRDAQDA